MTNTTGPWRRPPSEPNRRLRFAIWIGMLVLFALGLWKLATLFPGRAASDIDHAYIIQNIGIVALLSSGLIFSRRIGWGESFRNIAIWTGIAGVLMLAYSYQGEIADAALRVRAELIPSYGVTTDPHQLVLTADENGQFEVFGSVDGAPVQFLVDTGASDIVLSPADAKRLGVDVSQLSFTRAYETANGEGRGAPFTVASLAIGPIRFTNVAISINEAPMSSSLLGAPFFQRLASFEIKGRKLYLRSR